MPIDEMYWIGKKKSFDLSNEIEIYHEFILDYPTHIDMEEAKAILYKFINGTDEKISQILHDLL